MLRRVLCPPVNNLLLTLHARVQTETSPSGIFVLGQSGSAGCLLSTLIDLLCHCHSSHARPDSHSTMYYQFCVNQGN
jgi:hypothetical protein